MENLHTGPEAQAKLIKGFDKVADAVKGTLGAAGYNGLVEDHLYPYSQTTNDGVTIAKAIQLDDPVENMGANLAKEISSRADRQSNDGTTTAITTAQAILHEGSTVSEISPMQLKRELEACLPLIEASLDAQSKEITVDDVGRVATISAEDPTIGATIQEIYQIIGKDGILFRDISKSFNDHYTIGTGIKVTDAGFASPYMADRDENGGFRQSVIVKSPKILITKQKINSAMELNDLAASLYSKEIKDLVIFADDFEPTVVPSLVMTGIKQGFKFVLIKMPVLWKDWWFEDLAKLTGATIIDPSVGVSFKTMKPEYLGTCGSMSVDKTDTYLDGTQDVTEHLAALEAVGDDDSKIRIARMNQKTARYFVGAPTDQALSYRRLKVEDAVGASWQALHGGIVAGGGVALLNASKELPDTKGGLILLQALSTPLRQIAENAGITPNSGELTTPSMGLNAKTGEVVDMFEAGIVDPTNVVKNSVRNATSVAAQILTCKVIVTLPKDETVTGAKIPVL